jgi:hypothetical protein
LSSPTAKSQLTITVKGTTMSTLDQTIQALFTKLGERKAKVSELKAQVGKSWKTNGSLRLIGAGTPTNIQTASADVVDEVALNLCMLDIARAQAITRLGRPISEKVQGYTVDDWFSDLSKRLATINIRQEETELATLEARLNQVLSPEERRRIEVEMLAKELG